MHEFDEDTAIDQTAPGTYEGRITERWNIGAAANGGYVLAVGMAALRRDVDRPDPLSVTAHYLRASTPGPVTVHVEIIKVGRTYSTAMARMVQAGNESVRILATYGDLSSMSDTKYVGGAPPVLPPRDTLPLRSHVGAPAITDRFEIRSATLPFTTDPRPERPEVAGWLRFADGRHPDVHCLGLVADAFPPAAFHVLDPGWIPTLELTVHLRARPTSEWLRCFFRTRFIFGGLLEEDGEIWDESGSLVALSRQLAAAPR